MGSGTLFLPPGGHKWAKEDTAGPGELVRESGPSSSHSDLGLGPGEVRGAGVGQGWGVELSDHSSEHGTSQS